MDVHQSRKSSNLPARRRAKSKNNDSVQGYESDIVQAPKMPVINGSGRRLWTFKGTGTQPKRLLSNRPTGRRTATVSSSRRTSLSVRPKRTTSVTKLTRSVDTPLFKEPDRIVRSRSKSAKRTHSQQSHHQRLESTRSKSTLRSRSLLEESAKSKSRASSVNNSVVDSAASVNSIGPESSISQEGGLQAVNEEKKEGDIIHKLLNPETIMAAEPHRDSPRKGLMSEEALAQKLKLLESPCVTSYRKVVYNEQEHKWVEYEKLCETEDFYTDRMMREQGIGLPPPKSPIIEKPHRIKGRMTERLQLMFPTALVLDNRHREYHKKLKMTDQLRVELHKRRVQVVPTAFQKHILKFGKLPFRNNPRPHLIY